MGYTYNIGILQGNSIVLTTDSKDVVYQAYNFTHTLEMVLETNPFLTLVCRNR